MGLAQRRQEPGGEMSRGGLHSSPPSQLPKCSIFAFSIHFLFSEPRGFCLSLKAKLSDSSRIQHISIYVTYKRNIVQHAEN